MGKGRQDQEVRPAGWPWSGRLIFVFVPCMLCMLQLHYITKKKNLHKDQRRGAQGEKFRRMLSIRSREHADQDEANDFR